MKQNKVDPLLIVVISDATEIVFTFMIRPRTS